MTYLYKSTTDSVVNIGSYNISTHTGVELDEKVAELDAQVGKTLSRSVIKYAIPVAVVEPTPVSITVPTVEPTVVA